MLAVMIAWAMLSTICAAEERRRLSTIGELWLQDAKSAALYQSAFRGALRDLGHVDGKNVRLVARFANGDTARLPQLLAELIALPVDVMYVTPRAISIAKQAKTSVAMVSNFFDPVAEGLVHSLARPGGNITGMSWQSLEASSKRLQVTME